MRPHASQSVRDVETIGVRPARPHHCGSAPLLGYDGVEDVRQGKYFELDLATTEAAQAKALAAEVADKLLANPVIESYRIEVGD